MMFDWKKVCALTLTAACLTGLAACGGQSGEPEQGQEAENSAAQTETVAVSTLVAEYSDRDLSGEYYDKVTEITLGYSDVVIKQPGTYILSGTLDDGQVRVEAADTEKVQLVLNGVSITHSDGPAIYVKEADKVFLTLAEGTENVLADGGNYAVDGDENNPNACLFSQSDLTINGSGALTITAGYDHGVNGKDDLTITGGVLRVSATGDGLKGKDAVAVCGGTITITAGGDGIQSSNDTDESKGWVSIDGGEIAIEAGGDGIAAETQLLFNGGAVDIVTGGGADNAEAHVESMGGRGWFETAQQSETDAVSTKGLKAGVSVSISGGTLLADCCDDAVHCDGDITISAGSLTLASGDDGVHAGGALTISGGAVAVTESYEGLEGLSITISGGELDIVASDDGLNAAGGDDGGSGGMFGRDMFMGSGDNLLTVSGGVLYINALGDGLDSNGPLTVSGGEVYVSGPTNSGNGAIDCGDGYEAQVNGGIVMAAGALGMAETFGGNSSQYSFLISMGATVTGGTKLTVTDESGNVLLTATPENDYQCVVISTPELEDGATYTVTAGEATAAITLDGVSTSDGGGMMGGMGNMGGGHRQNGGGGRTEMPADGTMPEMPADGTMPEMPVDGSGPQMPGGGGMRPGGQPQQPAETEESTT